MLQKNRALATGQPNQSHELKTGRTDIKALLHNIRHLNCDGYRVVLDGVGRRYKAAVERLLGSSKPCG